MTDASQYKIRPSFSFPLLLIYSWFVATGLVEAILPWLLLRSRQLIYQSFWLRPVEIRQRKRETIVYDSWAAATETVSLFGCAGQQSDNGWRGLLEPAVPLGFVNAVRGGWRGSSAFISTFRDAHSCWPVDSAYLFSALSIVLLLTSCILQYPCISCSFSTLFLSLFSPGFLGGFEWIHSVLLLQISWWFSDSIITLVAQE